MRQKPLGRTGLSVSELCLGIMTWGNRTSAAEGHARPDMAMDHGLTFIDTAEMYPLQPVAPETIGRTEEILGTRFARSGRRGDVVPAIKITGAGQKAVGGGAPVTPKALIRAVNDSLKRLQTDVIHLCQIHWPNRGSHRFRQHWACDPSTQDRAETLAHMEAIPETAQVLVDQDRIRHFGLSNETRWGVLQGLCIARARGLPRVFEAVAAHIGVAATRGIDPCQMALAWLRTRPFQVLPIIGATSPDQPDLALRSVDVTLGDEVQADIADAHRAFPLPY